MISWCIWWCRDNAFVRFGCGCANCVRQIYQARVNQARPNGIDLVWRRSDADGQRRQMQLERERLVPANLSSDVSEGKFEVADGDEVSCGELEMFDSICKACFERQRVILQVTDEKESKTEGSADEFFYWRMNSWNCHIGTAVAPNMPESSDYHVRKYNKQAASSEIMLRQAPAKKRPDKEEGQGTTNEAGSKRSGSSIYFNTSGHVGAGTERSLLFSVQELPPSNKDWLLFSTAMITIQDHYEPGDIAEDSFCVFKLNDTEVSVSRRD